MEQKRTLELEDIMFFYNFSDMEWDSLRDKMQDKLIDVAERYAREIATSEPATKPSSLEQAAPDLFRENVELREQVAQLLDALKRMIWMERTQGVTDEDEMDVMEQAEQAIAKAEGK
jgi:hypothetical protein